MKNPRLARDYIDRARVRLGAVQHLFEQGAWADAVRESQEIVELALKALLRLRRIDPPRSHDVGSSLEENVAAFSNELQESLPKLAGISRSLRRDRELAFYGSEDLTPSDFYRRHDAEAALAGARFVVQAVEREMNR